MYRETVRDYIRRFATEEYIKKNYSTMMPNENKSSINGISLPSSDIKNTSSVIEEESKK